jgi:CubicO group peptidase (beta-lactamase class C family)
MLGLMGAAVASGTAVAVSPSANADTSTAGSLPGRIPGDLKPGGRLDRFIAERAAKDEFSGTFLLVHRDRPVLTRSYGMANKELSIPHSTDTIFALASMQKFITGIAVVQLVQQGKVKFHEKLGTYLDGFPAAIADNVPVHQLLTHTSGMGEPMDSEEYRTESRTWSSAEEVMRRTTEIIRRMPLKFTPGTRFGYSNAGHHVLTAIISEVSGQLYYDYVRKHIFTVAGMTDSAFYTRPQWRDDRRIARPYHKLPSGERVDLIDEQMFIGFSFATAPDLVRFRDALLNNKLLDPIHTKLALCPKFPLGSPKGPDGPTPELAFHCYGPLAYLINEQWVLWHNGGVPGASTNLDIFPESGWVTVALNNYDAFTVDPVALLARDLITRQR